MHFYPYHFIPQKKVECQLCLKECDETSKFEALEQTLEICLECQNYIKKTYFRTFIDNFVHDRNYIKIEPYCGRVKFKIQQTKKIYNLKKATCPICLSFTRCVKICIDPHYACYSCWREWVRNQFETNNVFCPYCRKQDDFAIFDFIPRNRIQSWYALNCQTFCCNYNCSVELILQPYKPIQGNVIQLSDSQFKCKKCKIKICGTCWSNHTGFCKGENEKLFKQYCKSNRIIKCPKCNIISEPAVCKQRFVNISSKQIQHCSLCSVNFCGLCNSVNLNIFPSGNSSKEVSCFNLNCQECNIKYYSKTSKFQRFFQSSKYLVCHTILMSICSAILFVLFLPGYQFLQVSKIVNNAVEDSILVVGRQKAPYILCCCGPIIAILTIAAILVLYVLLFIPLFLKNCYNKFNGEFI